MSGFPTRVEISPLDIAEYFTGIYRAQNPGKLWVTAFVRQDRSRVPLYTHEDDTFDRYMAVNLSLKHHRTENTYLLAYPSITEMCNDKHSDVFKILNINRRLVIIHG